MSDPEARLLEEAADWAICLRYDALDADVQTEFEQWRALSPAHAEAWERASRMFQSLAQIPAPIGREVLGRPKTSRRQALRGLALVAMAGPVGVLAWRERPWREWLADLRTGVGEHRAVRLPDASDLVLNTASAVDVVFTAQARRVRLVAGEILITTHADTAPAARPFLVETPQGMVRALGTRFGVRLIGDDRVRVSVFEHAVEITPAGGAAQIVPAGAQVDFDRSTVGAARPVTDNAQIWQDGMLLAQDMRLADVVAELARYRHGVLRCDPSVADLRVSGAVMLADTDAALDLLARSLAVRIVRRTDYWVTVAPEG